MKLKIYIKLLTSILIILSLMLVFPKNKLSLAQELDYDMSFSPPLLEIMIKPGKSITQSYWITNKGESKRYLPMLVPIEAEGLYGQAKMLVNPIHLTNVSSIKQLKKDYPYLEWFSLRNLDIDLYRPFSLKKGQKQQLVLKINIPENASEKDYYSSLVIFPIQDEGGFINNSQTLIGGGISSNILLTTSKTSDIKQSIAISQFELKKWCLLKNVCFNIVDSFDPVKLNLIVANTGKTLIKPVGQVTFSKGKDKLKSSTVLPENILANSKRQLRPVRCLEENEAECFVFDMQKDSLDMGQFKVKAELVIKNEKATSEVKFYVLPIKATLGAIVVALIYMVIKRFLKKTNP